MRTLHLNLKRKWFKMIFNGQKPEEYREIKEHWAVQLLDTSKITFHGHRFESVRSLLNILTGYCNSSRSSAVEYGIDSGYFFFKEFETITFSNGYSTERPQFEIELKGIEIREGNPEWGAQPGKKYFVLKLGEILNDVNCVGIVWEG